MTDRITDAEHAILRHLFGICAERRQELQHAERQYFEYRAYLTQVHQIPQDGAINLDTGAIVLPPAEPPVEPERSSAAQAVIIGDWIEA